MKEFAIEKWRKRIYIRQGRQRSESRLFKTWVYERAVLWQLAKRFQSFSFSMFLEKNAVFNRFPKGEASKLPNICRMQTIKHFSRSIVSLHEGHLHFSFGQSRTLWPLKYCIQAFWIQEKKRERKKKKNKQKASSEQVLSCWVVITRSLVAVVPRPPMSMTDVGTETALRLDQRKHFRKSKHLLRSEVSWCDLHLRRSTCTIDEFRVTRCP